MRIVGLMGRKRVGKDTFARTMVEHYGFTAFAFADPLRQALLTTDPIVDYSIDYDECCGDAVVPERLSEVVATYGWERAKDVYPEVRVLLQRLGTDAIRAIDPDFWVRAAMDRIAKHDGYAVVTDVRFPNEADAIRSAGGLLVRLTRPSAASLDSHASETALDATRTT